jgi:hypothetical protein
MFTDDSSLHGNNSVVLITNETTLIHFNTTQHTCIMLQWISVVGVVLQCLCVGVKKNLISEYKTSWLKYIVQRQIWKYLILQRTSLYVCELETDRYGSVKHNHVLYTVMTTLDQKQLEKTRERGIFLIFGELFSKWWKMFLWNWI